MGLRLTAIFHGPKGLDQDWHMDTDLGHASEETIRELARRCRDDPDAFSEVLLVEKTTTTRTIPPEEY